ncbi:hypothetical protein INR75_00240 [Zunongwangia sp. SCSIO 43204]|uniref:hypothetical protein n=1 Tax=Zunongwangia sp. SCSIO 43204 TaxID=2779359 RepID=UPI001CA9A6E9|nr:hypothetical protein [Zunongwangia sp. SCSIO 43204]UAB84507.1 hypothetical protein INR75_00240 [Zunongwangia sp. SCSIO 43204]
MNRIITVLVILIFSSSGLKAQNASVEKSLYGIQTGVLGIWGYNESRLADQFALRTEIGFDAGLWGGTLYDNSVNFALIPVITFEPRWYYNIKKRANKKRRTWNNGANFLSLETSFYPDLFVISNAKNVGVANQIYFIPKWGIKRNIGKHFGFEAGLGAGYGTLLERKSTLDDGFTVDLHLKIGYNF